MQSTSRSTTRYSTCIHRHAHRHTPNAPKPDQNAMHATLLRRRSSTPLTRCRPGKGGTPESARYVAPPGMSGARQAAPHINTLAAAPQRRMGRGEGGGSLRRAYAPALMLHRSHCMAVFCRSSRHVSTWALAADSFAWCAMYCSLRAAFSPWICFSARSNAIR